WFVVKNPGYTMRTMTKGTSETFVNASGMAIYFDSTDTRGTGTSDPVSGCTGACLSSFPVFNPNVSKYVVPTRIDPTNFTTFVRPDGATQLAYKGWPLYTYSGDVAPGDTNGNSPSNTQATFNPFTMP